MLGEALKLFYMSLSLPETVQRFVFQSPAHFVGGYEEEDSSLTFTFPTFGKREAFALSEQGALKKSYFTFSVLVPPRDPKSIVIQSYDWVGEEASALLGAFFGKFVINLGHIQSGTRLTMPSVWSRPTAFPFKPSFNDHPRKPNGPELNLKNAAHLLRSYVHSDESDKHLMLILRASEFYRVALENYAERPEMAFTFLISTLECLVDLREYSDAEQFDESLLKDLQTIEQHCPRGESIAKRVKGRLYQVRRKVACIVDHFIPDAFFEQRETTEMYAVIRDRTDLRSRVMAAYDVRSKLLHTGNKNGLWFIEHDHAGSEIGIGEPVLADNDLKKLVCKSTTLTGLERIVSSVLRSAISEWLLNNNSKLS